VDKISIGSGVSEDVPKAPNSWDRVAKLDALGVVLSERRKPYCTWTLDEFFATGEAEVSSALKRCRELGIPLKFGRAPDFGCGVGRLTRAFASRFSECVGIDVSGEMVAQARDFNKQFSNCEFVVNHSRRLPFPDEGFDFVSSFIVLQHMSNETEILSWIIEFVRVLRPGGAVVFQLPDKPSLRRRIQGRRRLWSLLQSLGVSEDFLYQKLGLTPIRMSGVSSDRVRRVMEEAGAAAIRVEVDQKAGAPFRSYTYFGLRKTLP
jgi:SAM-dependent methyltransferase